MNFEEAYEKYKNGTATQEEKDFVEQEIEKAKKISVLIDEDIVPTDAVAESNMSNVLRAKKMFLRKANLRILIIVLSCMLIVTATVLGSVFGVAISAAKKSLKIDMISAQTIAEQFVADELPSIQNARITEKERDLNVQSPLKSSRYIYYIEFVDNTGLEIEIAVDGKSGIATIDEID